MVYVATSAYQLHPRQILGAMVVIKDANLCIRFLSRIFYTKDLAEISIFRPRWGLVIMPQVSLECMRSSQKKRAVLTDLKPHTSSWKIRNSGKCHGETACVGRPLAANQRWRFQGDLGVSISNFAANTRAYVWFLLQLRYITKKHPTLQITNILPAKFIQLISLPLTLSG